MKLTDSAIRNAKPSAKPVRLFDGDGMYLEVSPAGGKLWRLKYRFGGMEKRLALGAYPVTGLKAARANRDAARKLLASGVDPSAKRKAEKLAGVDRAANSFEVIAREWHAKQATQWAASHADKILRRLERDVFPWIGARPVSDLSAPEVLAALRRIENRGRLETAHRALQNCGQVFRYAVSTGRAERDPTADLRGALTPWKPVHYASITDPLQVGDLLRTMDAYPARDVVRAALLLSPLLLVRPGELRAAEWSEFDLDAGQWNIPAERMKLRLPHVVPLPSQAVAILRDLHAVTGRGRYVFAGAHDPKTPMSNNAVNIALRRMGYAQDKMTGHGFRAMARTILDEVLHVRPDYIEHQLAHAVRDPNGRAYNRTAHLPERRAMMQQWADYLGVLKMQPGPTPGELHR